MINNENAHLYLPLLQALIDGRKLKHNGIVLEAVTFTLLPNEYTIVEPKTWYRMALMQRVDGSTYLQFVEEFDDEQQLETSYYFIRWLDDRKKYEVPNKVKDESNNTKGR